MFWRTKPAQPPMQEHECPRCGCAVSVRLAQALRGGQAWGEVRACVRCGASYAAPYGAGKPIACGDASMDARGAGARASGRGARDERDDSWLESLEMFDERTPGA